MAVKYRAWSFRHPDFDEVTQKSGLHVSTTGGIQMVSEDSSIRQSILLLLSTAKGERVMRPEYGCDLDQIAFMPNDETTLGLAIHLVRQALEKWEKRIQIKKLDAEFNKNEPGRMDIVLEYRIRRTAVIDTMMVPINIS